MKSIRLNKKIKEEILAEINNHINKKYETNPYYIEYNTLIEKFKKKFLLAFHTTYGEDLIILKKWNLGLKEQGFYMTLNRNDEVNITSNVFNKSQWCYIPFNSDIFIPVARTTRYRDVSSNYTIENIIKNNQELMELCKLIEQIRCDLETEKGKILKAYDKILSPITTTKALINRYPEMEKYITFLFEEEEKSDLTETEKFIQKFETEKET